MTKKLFILIFIYFLSNISVAKNQYEIVVTVNNKAITNLDLENEITIIKILNKNNTLDNIKIKNIAINNLVDEEIKLLEIEKNSIKIDKKKIKNYLNIFLKENKVDELIANKEILQIIEKKIKIDTSWNILINQLYGWKININMQEINNKIDNADPKITKKDKDDLKEKIINLEKNKKLRVFDKYHFNKIKKSVYIKYY